MPVNLNGMDPRVLAALKRIQDEARARGIETDVISGARSLEDQKQLYANWLAGRNHQPLPFPERGAVPLAAVPGTSEHEKGFAFDLQASDPSRQNELRGLAPSVGLKTIGSSDPNHFELAGGGRPSRPATGMATPKSDFLAALQHFESGGKNVPNTHQGTSSGQAQGFNQITTGTWSEFGGTKFAPDALHATKEQQDAIASSIPLKRWAPETLNYLRGQGFKLDPGKTLGENIAMNGGAVPSGGPAVASAAGAGDEDWQSLLGVPEDPGDINLGSMLSDAVAPASAPRAPSSALSPIEPEPQIDQSYALAAPPVQELGQRYEQGKATRKLSPLGRLFSLPTIGPQQVKPTAGPPPYTDLGVG
jgi:hypothetical protein